MFKGFQIELIIIRAEFNQIQRGKVTGRIVEEHIFATWV